MFFIHLFSTFLNTNAVEKQKWIYHCLINLSILHSPGRLEAEFISEWDSHWKPFRTAVITSLAHWEQHLLHHFIFLPWQSTRIHSDL